MILRNPSSWRDSLFIACSFYLFLLSNTISSQGVIGYVKENISHHAIPGAVVSILKGDSVLIAMTTDDNGRYDFHSSNAGRIKIRIHALGYKPGTPEQVLLDGYTTYRLENFLETDAFNLETVTISSIRPANPMLERISEEDLLLTAANFDDPVRVAQSKAGLILVNDQANHLSARGESPLFNSWYLEGLEIVNPNHTSNAGTLSDLPTQSGGGVNLFSAQVLGSTDVYTGINPLDIGRSAGAVIDMHLHESAKSEMRAKAGLLGFEYGGAQAIGDNGMLDLNLRYSFTGLLTNLGADFGGEKINFYDGVISYRQIGPRHKLKIYGWAGKSLNQFDHIEEPADRERYKDFFDIDFANEVYGGGIKYDHAFNQKMSLRTGASLSQSNAKYDRSGQFGPIPVSIHINDLVNIFSSLAELNIKHSSKIHYDLGLNYTRKTAGESPLREESFIRPYINTAFDLSQKFKIDAGIEINHSFLNNITVPGYRAVIQWGREERYYYLGARHAAGQVLTDVTQTLTVTTRPIIVDKYELGLSSTVRKHTGVLKIYFQQLNRLTIYEQQGRFIQLADFFDSTIGLKLPFNNTGISQSYGLEESWRYRNEKGLTLEFNANIYKSIRGTNEGEPILKPEQGRFSGVAAANILASKEIVRERKGKNRIWNFSLRGFVLGGLKEQIIDENLSAAAENTVYERPGIFDQRLPNYSRLDISISRTIANPKVRWRYALDIQNAIGISNTAYHYYDPFLARIETQDQLGIIPVLSVQASW
ncbi:MAG TPA: carboxypeptidase regulatory-like domain-containing protein [Saprospiraceae bacterium]|nr:carboxypeptidase regulatory-like domain-containing protein [Saprospiraceae bacterium]